MRMVKKSCLLVVFSLSFGLFCGELPESFSLSDDVSNDCVQEAFSSHAGEAHVAPGVRVPQREIASADLASQEPPSLSIVPSVAPSARSFGSHLLRLLSIQRK